MKTLLTAFYCLPPCHKVDQFRQAFLTSSTIHPSTCFSLSLQCPRPGRSEYFKVKPPFFLSQFAFPPPSPPSLLLHLHHLFPPSMPSFHFTTLCVLSTAGHASSEHQGEHPAPVMTACPSEYTFLSFPAPLPPWPLFSVFLKGSSSQLSVLPGPSWLSLTERDTVIKLLPSSPSSSSSISCSRPAVVIFFSPL